LETKLAALSAFPDRVEDPHTLRSVPILVIHAHSSCNCRCVMCDIWRNRDYQIFGVRELSRQLDSINRLGVHWIVFSGGEPLMNPELPAMCELLRARGIRTTLLTTGLLLAKRAVSVAWSFDDVIVSLDGPPPVHNLVRRVDRAFELLADGIQAVREVRPSLRITARTTVQKANHTHLRDTAHAAKALDLDQISFLAADLTSKAFNREFIWPVSRQCEIGLTIEQTEALESEIESLIRDSQIELPSNFVAESPEKLRRIVRHFRAYLSLVEPQAPSCNAPWASAVIDTDGSVRPCFFHTPIGKLGDAQLHEVLNSTDARAFRQNLDVPTNPICRNCVCSLNYRA
jgi:Fe-coproporphyrin III synthase